MLTLAQGPSTFAVLDRRTAATAILLCAGTLSRFVSAWQAACSGILLVTLEATMFSDDAMLFRVYFAATLPQNSELIDAAQAHCLLCERMLWPGFMCSIKA